MIDYVFYCSIFRKEMFFFFCFLFVFFFVVEICIANVRLHIFNNFLVIWDKVALDESEIVHRLTQNTRNTVLLDTEYFENRVPKLLGGCII